jgi:hypothetical protein
VSPIVAKPKKLDERLVAQLAFEGASDRDIAAILGCDHTTIASRFSPILKKRRAERRLEIRRKQNVCYGEGNVTMLIWLGKNELDQTDKVAAVVSEGPPKRIDVPGSDDRGKDEASP